MVVVGQGCPEVRRRKEFAVKPEDKTTKRKKIGKCQVRCLIRRDMAELLRIERDSFEQHWTEEDFLDCLRQRNCIGNVCEFKGQIVGFMIYERHKTRLHILNFAVDPDFCRQGVGSQMIDKLIGKLSQQRRTGITLEVRDSNLAAQLFFQNQGFGAVGVLRGHYEDTTDDAYQMEYRLNPQE